MGTVYEGDSPADLAARPFVVRDVDECLELLRGRAAYPDGASSQIARAWRRLMRDDALIASIVEARDAAGRPTVASFGASVFVTDEWASAAVRSREPHLALRTIRRELGGPTPILRPQEIVQGHAEGLNVLILHYAESPALPEAARPAVRYKTFEAFVEAHRGYRLKSVLQEFWDELDPEFVLDGWGRAMNEYAGFWERKQARSARPGRRPYLIGITREEALERPGNIAAPLFVHVPPRLGLTRGEQRLLRQALSGSTDVELARALGVAMPTIKSRWRAIYDRVGRRAPELVPVGAPSGRVKGARGQEKRRRLLAYLRRHPEELRP